MPRLNPKPASKKKRVLSNFERMIQLADAVFSTKDDPAQLEVNEDVIKHLKRIHSATVTEYDDGKGPAVWILLIPTTIQLMEKFLKGKITEHQLLYLTPLHVSYKALYLCSAMVLTEYRSKGIAKRMAIGAIKKIQKNHPIKTLFVWPFTPEGNFLADAIARSTSLPLLKKKVH